MTARRRSDLPAAAFADIEAFRRAFAARLPTLLQRATVRYEQVSTTLAPDDAKALAAQQAACRSALGHVESLLKLARAINPAAAEPDTAPPEDIGTLVAEAREAVARLADSED